MERWWSAPWVALVELSIGFIFYEIFQIKYTIRWRWVRYLFRYFQIFWIFLNISSGGVHLGWRWSSSGSGDRSIHRHHFHTTHTSHAHQAPCTLCILCTPSTMHTSHYSHCTPHHHPNRPHSHHFHSSCSSHAMQWRASPPWTQPQNLFNSVPSHILVWNVGTNVRVRGWENREIMQEKSDNPELELGERQENFGHITIYCCVRHFGEN